MCAELVRLKLILQQFLPTRLKRRKNLASRLSQVQGIKNCRANAYTSTWGTLSPCRVFLLLKKASVGWLKHIEKTECLNRHQAIRPRPNSPVVFNSFTIDCNRDSHSTRLCSTENLSIECCKIKNVWCR